MKKIMLLNNSISSFNRGDDIIMESTKNNFVIEMKKIYEYERK